MHGDDYSQSAELTFISITIDVMRYYYAVFQVSPS